MKKLIAVLLVSVFALTACGGSGGKVTNLNVNEFATKITDPAVTLIDVRTAGEFASGHIKGAMNIDWESGTFERDVLALDKTKTYAVYCRSGNRSGQATAQMAKDGFTSIFNLKGGIIDWTNAGQALVTE
jgi:rhodanese-related sulfurtransferase